MTADVVDGGPAQRTRILSAALDLMATNGAAATSMRQLAARCGLNVATLYHYFPSKADLLRALIADRDYENLLREVSIPVDASLAPRDRLAQLLGRVLHEALGERSITRLLVGETLRGDPDALDVVRGLADHLEPAIERWLGESFPELHDREAPAAVLTGMLFGFLLEDLVLPPADARRRLKRRATAAAAVVFP